MTLKILIIKMGYSETLDQEIGKIVSFGDVLRTTPILWALKKKFPDSHITWLVSESAYPLIYENKFIDRILGWDEFVPLQLMREKFDILINLEKIPGVCALADMIDAWTKYGFRFDSFSGNYHAYEKGLSFVDYIENKNNVLRKNELWQKVLIEMLGVEWKEQEYILGYIPPVKEVFDVGLNFLVGSKWPTKAMSIEAWKKLEQGLLSRGYTVSWQQGMEDLYEYMNWMGSNRIIITQDSLGLHLSLALHKKVIGLFGPTDPNETYMYSYGKAICPPSKCQYRPCYKPKCITDLNCMDSIDADEIIKNVDAMLSA